MSLSAEKYRQELITEILIASTEEEVKKFCDVLGNCPEETVLKYNIKKKDFEGKIMEVVLLSNS